MPTKVLIVDDDPAYLERFSETFFEEFEIHSFRSADALLQLTREPTHAWQEDVLLIDLHLPGTDGISAYARLKKSVPILPLGFLLTHDERPSVRMLALECGFHDVLTKSMTAREIFLRVRNSLAIHKRQSIERAVISESDLHLDSNNLEAGFGRSRRIQLTLKEFRILSALRGRVGEPIERDAVILEAWKETRVSPQTLNSHVFNLNRKLEQIGLRITIDRSGVVCGRI